MDGTSKAVGSEGGNELCDTVHDGPNSNPNLKMRQGTDGYLNSDISLNTRDTPNFLRIWN